MTRKAKRMPSKSERVYAELRERILGGEFSPGYRLVLSRVAGQYDMSPVPVREALRRLEAEGLVRYTQNVGAEVVGVDEADYSETMQVLAYLEGAATALAAPHVSASDLARAHELNVQMRRVREHLDPVLFTTLNHEFHEVLCGPCPNAHLSDLLAREWDRMSHIRRSTFSYVPDRSTTSVEEHDQLLELIETGAPADQVEQFARQHKLRTLHQFLDAEHAARPNLAAAVGS